MVQCPLITSLRPEKTSKDHRAQPLTDHQHVNKTMELSVMFSHFLNTSWDGNSTTSLGNQFQCLITLTEEILPDVQTKHPLAEPKAISSCPVACFLGEESNAHLVNLLSEL